MNLLSVRVLDFSVMLAALRLNTVLSPGIEKSLKEEVKLEKGAG